MKRPTLPLTFALAITSACGGTSGPEPGETRFALNDVSVLFPLPASEGELDLLLRPTSAGARGELLTAARYAAIPKLHVFQSPEETYAQLRVVAVRFDPCFLGDGACRPQIRMNMQPIGPDSFDGAIRAEDAAIHLLYDLSASDFEALLADLRGLRETTTATTGGPLRVHPILEAEGLGGRYAQDLRAIILRYAGDANLSRVTFMQLQNFNVNEWMFGGFDVGAEMAPIVIKDARTDRQRFINVFLESEEDFVASVDPDAMGADDVRLLFNSNNARAASDAAIDAAVRAAVRLENPDVHTAESTSCVACHVSTQARSWVEHNLGRSTAEHPDRFRSAEDLRLMSETTRIPGSLRAFGWLHDKAAISQRTVNETAAVLGRLAR